MQATKKRVKYSAGLNGAAVAVVMSIYDKYQRAEMEKDDVLQMAMASGDFPREFIARATSRAVKRDLAEACRLCRFVDERGNKISRLLTYSKWYMADDKEECHRMMMPIERCDYYAAHANGMARKSIVLAAKRQVCNDMNYWNREVRPESERRVIVRWN